MTAQLDGIESAQPTVPTPSAIMAQWFPAHVALPDGRALSNVRVFVTDIGLLVFQGRPVVDTAPGDFAAFFSPMDWPATLVVQPRLPQPRVAFELVTEAGPVKVTQQHTCGCHLRQLKNWVPSWTAHTMSWGVTG